MATGELLLSFRVGKNRVRRVMKLHGIKPYKRKSRWTKKKNWGQPPSSYPNLVKGSCPIKPNVFWAGDFTKLIWNGKVIYLATFIDLFTKKLLAGVSQPGTPQSLSSRLSGKQSWMWAYPRLFIQTKALSTNQKITPICWKVWGESGPLSEGKFLGKCLPGKFIEAIQQTINYYNQRRIHTKLKMPPVKFKQKFLNLPV